VVQGAKTVGLLAMPCELCKRELPLTFHHLIPKTLHSKRKYRNTYTREELGQGIDICQDCHSSIHQFIDEKTLGESYYTKSKLLSHDKLRKHIRWLGQRPNRRYRTKS
jgi:hypothetical protein